VIIRTICVTNIDIKVIIALSSVVHIVIVVVPFLIYNNLSIITRVIVIVTHAFGSSGIFFMAFIFYSRSLSRNLLINKGILRFDPTSRIIWIFIIIACISAPPRINLFAEVLSIISLISLLPYISIMIFLSVIISTAFSLILYSSTQQGIRSHENFYKINQCQSYGLLISFIHLFSIIAPLLIINKFII
jgi:NADH:ubiquinone oxidoreductase subunit 4 (subunit M)